jgi:hypothetical protein
MTRRTIATILEFDHGWNPQDVTEALRRLVMAENPIVRRTELQIDGEPKPMHIYSHGRDPKRQELDRLRGLCLERNRVLTRALLRDAGEQYVRAWLRSTGRFRGITALADLGRVAASDEPTSDVIATEIATGRRFAVSVKNQREWLRPNAAAIDDAILRASAHRAEPWLCVPFALPETIDRCARDGPRLSLLGAQIVPATLADGRRTLSAIDRLRAVIGPQPYTMLVQSRPERSDFSRLLNYGRLEEPLGKHLIAA